ncbi:MAG: hypothetical protein ABIQ39_09890, partial [Ilumatobacteraceae bacterium]
MTAKYPEIGNIGEAVNANAAVLDGELVCFGDDQRPSFEALQRHTTQAVLHIFDVLAINGNNTVELPYEQRRDLLVNVIDAAPNWLVPAHKIGDGRSLLAATAAHGMEGVMAKRLGSPYLVGRRSSSWRKVKNRREVELTIGGFTAGTGNRAGTLGALLVGLRHDDGLHFAGGVGTGFDQSTLEMLHRRLLTLRSPDCPFHQPP